MPFDVDTKDCTALSDAELSEMADLCTEAGAPYDVGVLSKQCEEWVLVTSVRAQGGRLLGFSFCTLERIGGTPSVLVGLASVKRGPRSEAVLKALVGDRSKLGGAVEELIEQLVAFFEGAGAEVHRPTVHMPQIGPTGRTRPDS